MKKIFLLDAMALIYRSFFAMQNSPRYTSYGLNTSAILGFANTIYDLIKSEKPTHIGVAFDTIAPTSRHIDFAEYKANREAMPEDLATSIPYIKEFLNAMNIPILMVEGYEADDIIGTIAKKAEEKEIITYMVTPDKDFGQLVTDKIFIYKPGYKGGKASILGEKEVCERYGIKNTKQFIDMLGLMGDASDNIPGILGIGEVTARKLLQEFDSVENLLQNADKIKNDKLREKVINGKESAIMSKHLATIILDAPIDFDEEQLRLTKPNTEILKILLEKLEMRTFAKRIFTDLSLLENEKPEKVENEITAATIGQQDLFSSFNIDINNSNFKNIETEKPKYYLIDNIQDIKHLVSDIINTKYFCFDTETTGVDTLNSELVGISFALKPKEAYYINIPSNKAEYQAIIDAIKPIFEDESITKIGQNLKFDIAILRNYNIRVKGKLFDTMIAHYIIDPDSRHNMDTLALNYLNYDTIKIESLLGKKGKNMKNMRDILPENIKNYACEDADITLQLKNIFENKFENKRTEQIFYEIEMPLLLVLEDMEFNGVKIDKEALNSYSQTLGNEIIVIQEEIWNLAGINFNISSPKQLGEILFDRLKIISNPKKTKTKQYQTGEDVLLKLIDKHPIVSKVLEFRSLSKLKSTYLDALPLLVNPKTGLLHTSYNQAVAATGRLSSTNPNLQNIPIKTEKGREIRKAFIPRSKDFTILSADYSQIELRIIASISRDENMLNAFINGMDIHAATAAKIYHVALNEVTSEMRRNAKSVNFGIIYGMSAFGLSEQLSIPRSEASSIIDSYFKNFHSIKKYIENTIEFAKQNSYVETLLGRRRYIKDINSANGVLRNFAERNAINAPIQGSAADMIKIAMINIFKEFKDKNLKSVMTMQVHDELVFDVFLPELEQVKSIVIDKMTNAMKLNVPITVEINSGNNWLEAH